MGGLSPTIKIQTMNQFVILSFGVEPLNWPSFIEIGEIACSTPAWCTHGLTLNTLLCTLRAVVSPGWTLRCEGRETTANSSAQPTRYQRAHERLMPTISRLTQQNSISYSSLRGTKCLLLLACYFFKNWNLTKLKRLDHRLKRPNFIF